jgi:hypothetical protein
MIMDERNFKRQAEAERLRAMLREDGDSPDEVNDLVNVVSRLKKWDAPAPRPEATARLLDVLSQEMPAPARSILPSSSHWYEWWPLLLIRSQVRVVRREIWAASALIMLLGTLVTLTSYTSGYGGATPIAILAPVVAALGVALLYDSDVEQMLELEDSTPASVRLLLLARLTLVFGFDLMLALAGSLALVLFHADVSLTPLVLSWLAPMTFLSGLAFLLSIVSGDAIVGSLAGLMIWGAHIWMRSMSQSSVLVYLLSLPGLSALETRPLLFVLTPILVVIGLWWVGSHERSIGDGN